MELNISMVDNVMEAMVSPQQRFLRCLMGAAKANKTELKMVVPSVRAFDNANPQASMAGAFGFSDDPDLRKGVLLRNLFPLITADDEVPQTFKWARDITSLSAIAKLGKMTRLIVATAGFVSGSKVWREGDSQKLSTDELRETAVQHVVRRGMVRALFAVTDSSCIKHTLTGVLFRAAFDKQGGVYSFNLLKDTVQGLQDLDASTCVLFADEVDRPTDVAVKSTLRRSLVWRLEYALQSRIPFGVLPQQMAEWETLQLANRQENGWVTDAKGLIDLIHDMVEGARVVAENSRRSRADSDSDVGSELGISDGNASDVSCGSALGESVIDLATSPFGFGRMQSPPSRTRGAKRRRSGEATSQQTGAAVARTTTELPSMHELMANHQNARRLLGRQMLVMRGDVPVQAVGTKVRVHLGRPQVWLDAVGGGVWMDATTALTNIVACGIVEKHPMLQNVQAGTAAKRQDFIGDGPKAQIKTTSADRLDEIIRARDVRALSADGARARKTFDMLGGQDGFQQGEQVEFWVDEMSEEAGLKRLLRTVYLKEKATSVVAECLRRFRRSVTVETVFQIAFFSKLLPDLTSLLLTNAKAEVSLFSNNQRRKAVQLVVAGVPITSTTQDSADVDLNNQGNLGAAAADDVLQLVAYVLGQFHDKVVVDTALVALQSHLLALAARKGQARKHFVVSKSVAGLHDLIKRTARDAIEEEEALMEGVQVVGYSGLVASKFSFIPKDWKMQHELDKIKERKVEDVEEKLVSMGQQVAALTALVQKAASPQRQQQQQPQQQQQQQQQHTGSGQGRGGGKRQRGQGQKGKLTLVPTGQQAPAPAPQRQQPHVQGSGGKGGKGGNGAGTSTRFTWQGPLPTSFTGPIAPANACGQPPDFQRVTGKGTKGQGDAAKVEDWCKRHNFATMEDARRVFVSMPTNRGQCFQHNSEPGVLAGGCLYRNCRFESSHN